jgi:CheY-like chemotaxis protein
VVHASGGDEAVAMAQQLRPDLILLDVTAPETVAADVLQALRQDNDTAQIPVVMVNAGQIPAPDLEAGAAESFSNAAGFVRNPSKKGAPTWPVS